MQSEIQRQLLIAAATRQGVPITPVEAETLATVLESDGLSLIIEADWTIKVHYLRDGRQHDSDWTNNLRELVEMAVEINEEAVVDASSERDTDHEVLFALHKDEYILNAMLEKTKQVILPELKQYRVGIVINHKIYDSIEATCWSEAEATAKKKWMDGKYSFSEQDFLGIMVTSG